METGSGVVHRHTQAAVDHASFAMDLADTLAGEEAGHRVAAQCDDDAGVNEGNLAVEIGSASGYLVRVRVAVIGRAAFHHISYEDVVTGEAGDAEQFVEELAGIADERAALAVFVVARPLTDEHHLGPVIALAGHSVGARSGKDTKAAYSHLRLYLAHLRRYEEGRAIITCGVCHLVDLSPVIWLDYTLWDPG
jgi:hypothetical protein